MANSKEEKELASQTHTIYNYSTTYIHKRFVYSQQKLITSLSLSLLKRTKQTYFVKFKRNEYVYAFPLLRLQRILALRVVRVLLGLLGRFGVLFRRG